MIWRLLNYRSNSAFENMAIDEAVFRETIKNHQPPTLRFYGWSNPAVSIGYFQELQNEIHLDQCRLSGVDLVRRITGGKAVYHRDEITYSLTAANSQKLFPDDINQTYEIISRCLARGLSYLGINACLTKTRSAGKASATRSCCFSVPAGNELLVAGRKICGSAQTRTHGGFLQQGSLLMTFDPVASNAVIPATQESESAEKLKSRVTAVNEIISSPVKAETLASVLKKGFIDELGISLSEEPLTSAEQSLCDRLIKKYQSDAWTCERKKEAFK